MYEWLLYWVVAVLNEFCYGANVNTTSLHSLLLWFSEIEARKTIFTSYFVLATEYVLRVFTIRFLFILSIRYLINCELSKEDCYLDFPW